MFNRFVSLPLTALLLIAGLNGCSSDQEKARDTQLSLMNEFADDLSSIKSNADFVEAKPKLEKLGAKIKDAQNAEKKLTKPTAEERTALETKYKPEAEKAQARIKDEMQRLQKDVGLSPFDVFAALGVSPMDM